MDDDDLRRKLNEVGARRAAAVAARNEAAQELVPLVREAQERGFPLAEIGRIAALSRQGVYDLLRRAGGQDH